MKRLAFLAVICGTVAFGFGLIGASSASAVPANGAAIAKSAVQTGHVIQARDGCGPGWYRNR